RIVEAQLPVNHAPPMPPDRPFWLEESAPSDKHHYPAPTRGEPSMIVGPLMRWTVDNDSLTGSAPTVYIQGVAPVANKIDPTANPMIELYQAGSTKPRLGLAYTDTVAPNATLRLRPSPNSWLGLAKGLQIAQSIPPEGGTADPTAPGPWQAAAGGPTDSVVAIYQSTDLALWVATNLAGGSTLARFDGTSWSNA